MIPMDTGALGFAYGTVSVESSGTYDDKKSQ